MQSSKPPKPSDAEKRRVEETFAPLIAKKKAQLPPLEDPQKRNQCVDIKLAWRGSYFTLKGVFKCPPTPQYVAEGFESGIARLTYRGKDQFDLAYLRHNDKWFVVYQSVSLKEAVKSVDSDPWFEFF
ncbi:MAG: hypothetical protein AAF399_17330 [Bacteroidota bacterium]